MPAIASKTRPHLAAPSGRAPASVGVIQVSVCVANWNGRDVLYECLASLCRAEQGVSLEVIVVDNGSSDRSAEMVREHFPGVRLICNEKNLGFARANNQAARVACGQFLFFLNNDTVLRPGSLRRLVRYAAAHPAVGIVGPRLRDATGRVQVSYRPRPTLLTFLNRLSLVRWSGVVKGRYRRYRRSHFDPDTTRKVEVLMGAAMLLPRQVFQDVGGWDDGFEFGGEDLDLCYRVGQRHPLVYFPRAEITHVGRVSTRRAIGPSFTMIAAGFVRYLRKTGAPPLGLWCYKALVTVDTPVELVVRSWQYLIRRALGRKERAAQTELLVRQLGYFLVRGLGKFWRA